MTVVYVVRSFPRSSQTFVLNEIRTAERLGTDIRVASLSRARDAVRQPVVDELCAPVTFLDELLDWRNLAPAVGRTLRRHPARVLRALVAVARDGRVDRGYTSEGRWRCLAHALVLADLLADTASTHLHAHFAHDPAYVASLTSRLTGVSFSFTGHARDLYQIDQGALADRIERAAFVVTVTDHNRVILERAAVDADTPISVIPQGADTTVFSPPSVDGTPPADLEVCQLLAIGRLVPKKGFDVLLAACASLRASGRRFHCTIVGDGPEAATLRKMIVDLELTDTVTLEAERPQEDLVELYRTTHMFVLPAIVTDDGDSDALPTVLLEAMACGVPVVTTRVGGIGELVESGETGLLVESGDHVALAAAIRSLLDDPSLGRRLGCAARATVANRFDHENGVTRLVELFSRTGAVAPSVAVR